MRDGLGAVSCVLAADAALLIRARLRPLDSFVSQIEEKFREWGVHNGGLLAGPGQGDRGAQHKWQTAYGGRDYFLEHHSAPLVLAPTVAPLRKQVSREDSASRSRLAQSWLCADSCTLWVSAQDSFDEFEDKGDSPPLLLCFLPPVPCTSRPCSLFLCTDPYVAPHKPDHTARGHHLSKWCGLPTSLLSAARSLSFHSQFLFAFPGCFWSLLIVWSGVLDGAGSA